MTEQGESFLKQKEKITPQDVKDLAYHLDDYFSGINPKEKPIENESLNKEQEKWGEYLDVMDQMVTEKYITSLEKKWIITMLLCKKENDSDHDSLTGLYNRRGFGKITEIFINEASHDKTPISVAYLDIDNFKNLNDQKGHGEGDNFLRKFAAILETTKRKQDIACRYGGDEFLLLLNLSEKESQKVITRIEKIISKFVNFSYTDLKKPLSFSAGVISWNGQEGFNDFLNRADDKMMKLKKIKKNPNG